MVVSTFSDDFVGKVFKVTHDKQKGALSLVRIINGKLRKGSKLVTSRGNNESLPKLYEALADEYREIQEVGEGDIAVCAGLKVTHRCTTGVHLIGWNGSIYVSEYMHWWPISVQHVIP